MRQWIGLPVQHQAAARCMEAPPVALLTRPTDCLPARPPPTTAVSDAGIFASEVLEARAVKEAAAVAAWQRNTADLHTLADLHAWLFATHLCYSVGRQHEFGREQGLDPRLAASY